MIKEGFRNVVIVLLVIVLVFTILVFRYGMQQNWNVIFALWDSLTEWYRLPVEESYPSQLGQYMQVSWFDYTIINGGKSWDTSAGLLDRLNWVISDSKPGDIALVVIGANDWIQLLSLEELERNISLIVEALLEKNMRIVLWWMQLPTNIDSVYREDFAAIYPHIAKKYSISLIPFFLENVAMQEELNHPDGIHPNAEWNAVISNQVFEYLIDSKMIHQ